MSVSCGNNLFDVVASPGRHGGGYRVYGNRSTMMATEAAEIRNKTLSEGVAETCLARKCDGQTRPNDVLGLRSFANSSTLRSVAKVPEAQHNGPITTVCP